MTSPFVGDITLNFVDNQPNYVVYIGEDRKAIGPEHATLLAKYDAMAAGWDVSKLDWVTVKAAQAR